MESGPPERFSSDSRSGPAEGGNVTFESEVFARGCVQTAKLCGDRRVLAEDILPDSAVSRIIVSVEPEIIRKCRQVITGGATRFSTL